MRTKDNKSRRTEQESEEALNYFHNSYLDTSRSTCEVARKVGDPSMPRLWPRYSKVKVNGTIKCGPGAGAQILPANKSKGLGSSNAAKVWANDTFGIDVRENHSKKKQSSQGLDQLASETTSEDDVSDMDYFRSKVKNNQLADSDVENIDNEESAPLVDESKQAIGTNRLFVPKRFPYKLSESALRDSPFYLERAPENVLTRDTTSDRDEQKNVIIEKNINNNLLERSVEGIHQEDIDLDRVEVLEYIAKKLGISKRQLLNIESDDLAARIAIGETQLIAETNKVNIAALEECASGKTENIKRSSHVILARYLPYETSEEDLAIIFGLFGSLDRVILPPTKALALVVFLEAAEAREAFKSLAYRRYKDSLLYLEMAPENVLSPDTTSDRDERKNVIVGKNINSILLERSVEGIHPEDIDLDRVESRSVYVKNLNFETSDESSQEHFSKYRKKGSIKSFKVKKHRKNGKNVSMGDLQGTILDGHTLSLQLCHAGKYSKVLKKDEKDKSPTKLIVRNVAFEATKKDLRQLFSPFGQVKSLRLPKKFGSHRGFAVVEYVTKQEAQNAIQSLSSTHLYGRHLVIELAKEGENLEELRARTAAQFVNEQSRFQKLSKKRKRLATLDEGTAKFATVN